jgi:hypothetical protein
MGLDGSIHYLFNMAIYIAINGHQQIGLDNSLEDSLSAIIKP